MKTLKFRKKLSELILSGEKTTTSRLFDDKNLSVGDRVEFLIWETSEKFIETVIMEVKETTLGKLAEEDLVGHEKFCSEGKMYKIYSTYYKREVDKNSLVKVIKFKILNK